MTFGNKLLLVDRQWLTPLTNARNYEVPELWRLLNHYEGSRYRTCTPELLATLDDRVRQVSDQLVASGGRRVGGADPHRGRADLPTQVGQLSGDSPISQAGFSRVMA